MAQRQPFPAAPPPAAREHLPADGSVNLCSADRNRNGPEQETLTGGGSDFQKLHSLINGHQR